MPLFLVGHLSFQCFNTVRLGANDDIDVSSTSSDSDTTSSDSEDSDQNAKKEIQITSKG